MKIKIKPRYLFFSKYYLLRTLFFAFIFLVNNVIIELLTSGHVDFSKKSLTYLSVVSLIIGLASGARIWIFAKLDERKSRKVPPSDPE